MRAVLTFHSIDNSRNILSCTIKAFEHLLHTLDKKNIPILPLQSLLNENTPSGVALTFDDGMQSLYSNALPVLQHYDATAHLFLATGLPNRTETWPETEAGVGSYSMLNWSELDELQKRGLLIESHTHNHPNVQDLTTEQLHEECCIADEIILQRTGREPQYFAYPFGCHNSESRSYIGKRYQAAFTTELKYLDLSDQWAIPRLDSYYLGHRQVIENIDSFIGKSYLRFRWHLRNFRSTQTQPDAL